MLWCLLEESGLGGIESCIGFARTNLC
uniref:Uncharacterized protein n=1 Tax=Rhizophora mucronata TaxID=61149 RepID=A0A2P2QVN3_RHIMU